MLDGVNVAVEPLHVTVPVTPLTSNVAVLMVEASTISLNVAIIVVFTAIPVELVAGLEDDTVGEVVSVVLVSGDVESTPQAVSVIAVKHIKSRYFKTFVIETPP